MKPRKYNFVPFLGNESLENINLPTVTISKGGAMIFSSTFISTYQADGKFIKLFVDREKRAIGWKFIENAKSFDEINGKAGVKQIKSHNNNATLSIRKLLNALEVEKGIYRNLPVNEYRNVLDGTIYYILIPEQPDVLAKVSVDKPEETE